MVVIEEVTRLSERRTQTSSEAFPDEALSSIRAAVEAVPVNVFDDSTKHTEVGGFDAAIADRLSQYEYEGDATGGYNPNCKLWSHQGFNYSVDLYDADARIAIEVEKKRAEERQRRPAQVPERLSHQEGRAGENRIRLPHRAGELPRATQPLPAQPDQARLHEGRSIHRRRRRRHRLSRSATGLTLPAVAVYQRRKPCSAQQRAQRDSL